MEQAESLEAFFQAQLDQALKDARVSATTMTEHYLVTLLSTYATQPIDDKPLALKMLEAQDAGPRQRRDRLREVGDQSLFVSGFWSDSFARRTFDVDYYIDLGGSAYNQLAQTGMGWARDPYGDTYGALAQNFGRFVGVLAKVSQRMMPAPGPQDVVRLYERWLDTRSQWAAQRLAGLGVCPQRGGGKPQ